MLRFRKTVCPDDVEGSNVGYRKPPRATRFTKGQSGNPAGRHRRHREAPYEAVLGQMVKIREGGACHGGRGLSPPAHKARARRRWRRGPRILGCDRASKGTARRRPVSDQRPRVGECGARQRTSALEPLRMARKLDPYRETAGARTVARRGSLGPPQEDTQSRRTTDHGEGYSYTSQGPVAGVVERTPRGRLTCP
jgi:hypothetical protein